MKVTLKNDIIEVLEYFEYGLSDIQECSSEEQLKLKEIRSILHRLKANGDNSNKSNCNISHDSVSLRDYIATECMKSEIIAWNKEMSNKHRSKLLEDMIKRYGNIKINDAIALMSYEMADAMLSARSNKH